MLKRFLSSRKNAKARNAARVGRAIREAFDARWVRLNVDMEECESDLVQELKFEMDARMVRTEEDALAQVKRECRDYLEWTG